MMKLVIFCLLVVTIPHVIGQTTLASNITSTNTADDIYLLSEEDFKLWISGETPKAWETSTHQASTTTETTTEGSRLLNQFSSVDQSTTPRPELSTTPRSGPTLTPSPALATTPKTDGNARLEGYVYPRPENIQNWLQRHMMQSQQINNQLISSANALPFFPRYSGSVPSCIPTSQTFGFHPEAVSFQTSAIIHRFHGNTAQQVPFPGSSHHGDAFLSQNQHQKPHQQQQQQQQQHQQQQPQPQPQPQFEHLQQLQQSYHPQKATQQPTAAPMKPQGHRITEFYGNPLFFRPPVTYVPATAETAPFVIRYY